jgi:hypothetical protein
MRWALIAALAAATAPALSGCGKSTPEKEFMRRAAGTWIMTTPGSVYSTVEELQLTDDGEYTRRTFALVQGKERRLFIKRFTLESEVEPPDPSEVRKLEQDGYRPWIEKGRYSLSKGETQTTITFKANEELGPKAKEFAPRPQDFMIKKDNTGIRIGGREYTREEAGARK